MAEPSAAAMAAEETYFDMEKLPELEKQKLDGWAKCLGPQASLIVKGSVRKVLGVSTKTLADCMISGECGRPA